MLDLVKANVIGNIHLFNLTIPLVLRGEAKKVIAISTGMADVDLTAKFDLTDGVLYSISKAALNMAGTYRGAPFFLFGNVSKRDSS